MKLSLFIFLILLSALPAHDVHAAACSTTIMAGVSFDADADSALVDGSPGYPYPGYGLTMMGYDYHQGRFFGYCSGCYGLANIEGSDTYQIQGPPAGVPIHIHVELQVNLGAGEFKDCSYGGMEHFGLAFGIHTSQTMHTPDYGDSADYCVCECSFGGTKSVGLDLTVLPDEAFVLSYSLEYDHGPSPGGGKVEATVHFSGVPAGAQLVSCHGVNDAAVATKPSTWGRVKAAYR
jgi:hypothetical protein